MNLLATPLAPTVRPGSIDAWAIAMRPRTLWIAAIPVMVGTALAWSSAGRADWLAALLALAVAVIMQVITNLQNDVGYTSRVAEATGKVGLPRATSSGLLQPRQVRIAIVFAVALAIVLGLPLVARGGWPILALGVASILCALSYMGGPRPIAYTPLGELAVFVFFGLVSVCGTVFLHTGEVGLAGWLAAAAVGALAAAVLVVNNHRDIAHDRATGRRTFAVVFGPGASLLLYATLVGVALALCAALAAVVGSAWLALPLVTAPRALRLVRELRRTPGGAALNALMLRTVMLEVAFGALLTAGAVLQAIVSPVIGAASAQAFPTKTVRIVVPFSVGLGPDIVARAVADSLTRAWRQPVVVDNRPGASGIVAMSEVRRVHADGHTLFVGDAGSISANPHLYASLPYDPARDLIPVSTLFRATFVMWVGGNSRFESLKQFLETARREPGKVSYASFGAGHPSQLAVELLAEQAGMRMLHVPFKDAGQLIGAIANNDVDMTLLSMNSVGSLAKAGRLRALAVGSRSRLASHPELPTIAEAGGPAVELAPWAALFAVAGTPAPVLDTIHRGVVDALQNPEIRNRIEALGFEVRTSTPDALARLAADDSAIYASLIRARGLRPE